MYSQHNNNIIKKEEKHKKEGLSSGVAECYSKSQS
jgi:hypothetical protein